MSCAARAWGGGEERTLNVRSGPRKPQIQTQTQTPNPRPGPGPLPQALSPGLHPKPSALACIPNP